MRGRFLPLGLWLCLSGIALGLDAQSQKLADRYLAILTANPMQQTAFDRLWKIHSEGGEIDALIAVCQQRAAEAPVLYARVLQRAGRTGEAKKVLAEAAGSGILQAAEMLSGLLEEDGDLAAAAKLLEEAPGAQQNPAVLVRLGELLLKTGELDKSRSAWNRAVALDPGDLALRKRLAAASIRAADWNEAVAHLQVIAKHGTPSERFNALGEISLRLESAGKIAEAIDAQDALLHLMGPGHWQLDSARRRLLSLHDKNHSLDVLEKQWRADAESDPRDPQSALRLAKLYEFQGDDLQRHEWLSRAATLLPNDVRLLCDLAALDLALGNPQAAASRYDKVLASRPDDRDIIFLRAEASALMEQEGDAEERIESYLRAHADDDTAAARAVDFYKRMQLTAPLERKLSAAFLAHPDDLQAVSDLARFYLDQRRDQEAISCLARFEASQLDAREAAEVAFRFSELLSAAGTRDEEIRWARKAFEKNPSKPEYALQLADLLQNDGQTEAMIEVLRKACAASEPALPREDLDRRLFLALQAGRQSTPEEQDQSLQPAIREMIELLDTQAQQSGNEASWLRLARWLRWADGRPNPISALRRGLDALPQSKTLQEALAVQLADSGDSVAAIEAFARLVDIAPERHFEIRRRIGHLELDRGNTDDSLRIFQALADESKDWQTIADLALAQQMSGNWFEAFETWQRAYSLAPPDARRSLRTPILNAATRLQLFPRALDFLENACATEGSSPARKELLDEAGSYAVEHGITDDWRSRIERRARSSSDERLWQECLASLLTAEGKDEEALGVLKASTTKESDDSIEELEKLIKLAEKAADWDEAARLARRIVFLAGAQDAQPSIRYADFLERAGRREEAENVWRALAARHARNPQVLSAAGDFFERAGNSERAENSYRAAARFSGCAPQVLLRLGRFASERGDRAQALKDFEAVLRETRPQPDSYRDCIPLPERILRVPAPSVRASGPRTTPWKVPAEADAEGCRLLAIREIGRLAAANTSQRKQWIEELSEPVERIWASFHSGERAVAFLEIERLTFSEYTNAGLEQSFAALAMDVEADDALRRWIANSEQPQAKWDSILAAMIRMLEANWRPSGEFLSRLFAQAPALTRWQASEALASKNLFRAACTLGESVPDALPASQACSAWIELARWWIALCEPDEAIDRFDKAIASAPSAISFGEPLFLALRARWMLTPDHSKRAFEENVALRLKASKHPRCESAAAALISSLKGDDAAAAEKLAEMFPSFGSSDDESWSQLVQQGGNQLEEWNLHRLARDLYRNDLARDSALLSLRGENFRDATIGRFILNQLVSAETHEVPYLLNEWVARGASDRELLDAVIRLQHSGRVEAAAVVYKRLCDRNPRNEGIRSGILNLIQARLLQEPGTEFFERLLAEEYPGLGRAIVQTAGLRLAAILDEEGKYERSLAILERLGREGPLNRALLLRHVQTLTKVGRHREALAELEASPLLAASAEFTGPMVELYLGLGREQDAVALLERDIRSGPPRNKVAAAKLREIAGTARGESLRSAAIGSGDESSPAGATTMPSRDWKKMLVDLDNPTASDEERFRAVRSFLLVQQDLPSAARSEQMQRLKRIALRIPTLLPEYYALRKELAERYGSIGELLNELSAEWDQGRGTYQAGEVLVQILLQHGRYEEIGAVLDSYLTDTHFNERVWDQIGRRLLDAQRYELAARTFSELAKRMPGNATRALLLAQALFQTGKRDAAEAIVTPIKRIAVFEPQRNFDLIEFYLATGRSNEARPYLLAAPLDARSGAAWIEAMKLFLEQGDFAAARDSIRRAMDTPQVVSVRALADYYSKTGELLRHDPRVNEFGLAPRQFRAFQIEVTQRLLATHDDERAWPWIESIDALLDDLPGRTLLQSLESSDWDRATALWEACESPLWEVRCAKAEFFMRRAEANASEASALRDLARAHELHPGSFPIAKAYVERLLQSGEHPEARKVLQDVIEAYAAPADRRAAQEILTSRPLSHALPKDE